MARLLRFVIAAATSTAIILLLTFGTTVSTSGQVVTCLFATSFSDSQV
jgi:hypothetical protein